MACIDDIWGFPACGKASQAQLAEGVKLFLPACEELVGIGLVAYIPNQLIFGAVESEMQGDGGSTVPRLDARCLLF